MILLCSETSYFGTNKLMLSGLVPLTMVRRHRLNDEELMYVMKAVHLRLSELRKKEISPETESLFRVLWRFTYHRRGPPGYL